MAGVDTETGGTLLAFTPTGAPFWDFSLEANTPSYSPSSGKFAIREVIADDLYGTGKKQFILLMYDAHGWQRSGVVVVNWDGIPMWTYWHPGHVTHVVTGREHSGSQKRIVLGAINNALADDVPGPFPDGPKSENPRTVFILNPYPTEMAPPFHKDNWEQTALLKWYGVISPEPFGIEKLDIIDHDRDGQFHISLWATGGRGWNIKFSGEIIEEIRTAGPLLDVSLHQVFPQNDELEQALNHSDRVNGPETISLKDGSP